MSHPVIGLLLPYTGVFPSSFEQFDAPTMHGLARVSPDGLRIDFLAIQSKRPGKGNLGIFLADLMEAYRVVAFWEVYDAKLQGALVRRGFRDVREYIDGDFAPGLRWDRGL